MLVGLSNPEAREGSSSDEGGVNSRLRRSELWASLLCLAIYSAAVAIIWPVVELATDDDFAYAKIALIFEQTGHFVFNGWETAMVGWQVVWGALFIRLFGYSYLTLRLSTIVLAALLTLLLHRVLLRAGVRGAAAVLGTLTVVLSPLFLPMVTSYMTDIPALLCILVCLYGCQRALRASSDKTALLWLCGSAALNVLDGTVRQIVWLGTLVIVPSAFWLLRKRKGFKMAAVITWLLSVLSIALMMMWFLHQPYVLQEHIIRGSITGRTIRRILRLCVYGPMEVFCLSLPVLVAWIYAVRVLSRRRKLQIIALCAAVTPFLLWAAHYNKVQGRLPPWSANVVSPYGILWSIPLMGDRPVTLSISITSLIAIVLLISLFGFLLWLSMRLKHGRLDAHSEPSQENELSIHETGVLVLPFSLTYLALLMPRAAFPSTFSDVFDRYYLPLMMFAVILLLRLLRERRQEIPVVCYVMLLLFSFFSITDTHDLFAAYRATAVARSRVEAAGVSPYNISGPWQEDGSNQIAVQGYLNDARITNPPNAFQPPLHPELESCHYWWGPVVPALHFQYALTVEKLKCLVPSQFPDVTYTTWLPPFHRTIYIERNPEH
jgi:hypothetical protein